MLGQLIQECRIFKIFVFSIHFMGLGTYDCIKNRAAGAWYDYFEVDSDPQLKWLTFYPDN
jgi:aromatic ring-opening dioxygenase catalytic subunit (LigB family)